MRRPGRDPRTPRLRDNGARAFSDAVIQLGAGQPPSRFVRLSLNGIARDSATYNSWGSAPTTRQVVLAHDATSDATGVYPFTLLVRNQYSGANYDATLSGNLIVVNRSQSEF